MGGTALMDETGDGGGTSEVTQGHSDYAGAGCSFAR